MNIIFRLLFILSAFPQIILGQDQKYHSPYNGFEKGDSLYTFNAENLVYSSSKPKSKPSFTLPPNQLIIVEKSVEANYDNPYSPEQFLAISVNGKSGFIQLKNLATAKEQLLGTERSMLFQYRLDTNQMFFLKYREFYKQQIVLEADLDLMTSAFSVYVVYPAGLDSITGILILDHHAEACGYDGGETYYYYNPEQLEKMAHLVSVGDGGVYYRTEQFIFPADSGGIERKIIFEAEEYNLIDEETQWEEVLKERRVYKWIGGRIYPEFGIIEEE